MRFIRSKIIVIRLNNKPWMTQESRKSITKRNRLIKGSCAKNNKYLHGKDIKLKKFQDITES